MIGCSVWHLRSATSPSMRREWIEIGYVSVDNFREVCLPPCGGSGLKYNAVAEWVAKEYGLPPCGGSGLK